jgi:ATP-dependent DNA ligase
LVEAVSALPVHRFILDGEIIIREQPFETLLLRPHRAATRMAHLAKEHPTTFVAFDMLGSVMNRSTMAPRG